MHINIYKATFKKLFPWDIKNYFKESKEILKKKKEAIKKTAVSKHKHLIKCMCLLHLSRQIRLSQFTVDVVVLILTCLLTAVHAWYEARRSMLIGQYLDKKSNIANNDHFHWSDFPT